MGNRNEKAVSEMKRAWEQYKESTGYTDDNMRADWIIQTLRWVQGMDSAEEAFGKQMAEKFKETNLGTEEVTY